MTAQQLKNSILQMAIQGKLVPQDPNDEPASVLLERIHVEKERLIKAKKLKREKNPSVIFRGADNAPYEKVGKEVRPLAAEVPFDIPDSWEWVRLGVVNDMYTGNSINATEKTRKYANVKQGYYYIGTKDIGFDHFIDYDNGVKIPYSQEIFRIAPSNSILLCIEGGSAGRKIGLLREEVCFGNKLCCFIPYLINNQFLYYYLQSPIFQNVFKEKTSGIIGGVSINTLKGLLFPIPPLEEQLRIVNEYLKLKPLIQSYERLEKNINALDSVFPELLKKSILQQAVQGNLVPQDPADEPAEILLEQIRKEKARLVKEGKIKKGKHESTIFRRDNSHYEKLDGTVRCINNEIPFAMPKSWEWVRLANLCSYIQRGKSPIYSPIKKYPVIAQKCNQWSGFSIEKAQFIEPDSLKSYEPERFLQDGDLLWNSTGLGTLGRMAIYSKKKNPYELAVADSHVTVIRPLMGFVVPMYLYLYFSNPTVQNVIEKQSEGTTKQKELSISTVKSYLIPLPPILEQNRIVNRIERLLILANSLVSVEIDTN